MNLQVIFFVQQIDSLKNGKTFKQLIKTTNMSTGIKSTTFEV